MTERTQPLVTAAQLGALLRGTRKSLKWTQAQLAQRVDLSQRRISELEREPGTLSVDQLITLCNQLGLQVVIQAKPPPPQEPGRPQGEW